MKIISKDVTVKTLVNKIFSDELNLQPDFQRGEVWNTEKKRKFIDSILREWHVPPIYVVQTNNFEEVIDGQQRLASIRDFVLGRIKIDGNIEPLSDDIRSLHNLTYNDMPFFKKMRFDDFSIRVFTLIEYSASEPAELFYRLNEMNSLSPAEQRNAYYGKVREQVKNIVDIFDTYNLNAAKIGFSNSRMNYDDIIVRFLVYIDNSRLDFKITAGDLANLYKKNDGFSENVLQDAENVMQIFCEILIRTNYKFKFNKATLLSWLIFIFRYYKYNTVNSYLLEDFMIYFETSRNDKSLSNFMNNKDDLELIKLFNDRSTSRIWDTSSIQLRDFSLNYLAYKFYSIETNIHWNDVMNSNFSHYDSEDFLLYHISYNNWSEL